jgi:glycosyltransferase involved in cell wall biosynthesis
LAKKEKTVVVDGITIPPVTIIISSYNEENNILETLTRIFAVLPQSEVLLVEGGNDQTIPRALDFKSKHSQFDLKVIQNKHDRGKGHGIRIGVQYATKDIMAQVDADSQFPPEELPQLLKPILDGEADITFCSRFMDGATVEDGSLTNMRWLANQVVSGLTSLLSGTHLTDVNAGFKAWTAKAIRDIDLQCDHFGYEPEIAIMASKKGYKIREVPVTYAARNKGTTRVQLLRDGVIIPLFLFKTKLFR